MFFKAFITLLVTPFNTKSITKSDSTFFSFGFFLHSVHCLLCTCTRKKSFLSFFFFGLAMNFCFFNHSEFLEDGLMIQCHIVILCPRAKCYTSNWRILNKKEHTHFVNQERGNGLGSCSSCFLNET